MQQAHQDIDVTKIFKFLENPAIQLNNTMELETIITNAEGKGCMGISNVQWSKVSIDLKSMLIHKTQPKSEAFFYAKGHSQV
jgi:hypothetical protein